MKLNRKADNSEYGFTLMEVIIALLITSILLITSLRFFTGQWRGTLTTKNYLEAHYSAMTAGKTINDSIRTSRAVEWISGSGRLQILPMPDDTNPTPAVDTYFIGDLDRDGTRDLYWKHLNISQPIASNITSLNCLEVKPGLWEIVLEAQVDDQIVPWCGNIRRVMYSP